MWPSIQKDALIKVNNNRFKHAVVTYFVDVSSNITVQLKPQQRLPQFSWVFSPELDMGVWFKVLSLGSVLLHKHCAPG